ncbi:MAG: hypothetical protein RLZZ480_156 [Candidatus Parcubacteria bacterium]|jgi:ribonuclease HI
MQAVIINTAGDSRGNPGPAFIGVQVIDNQGKVLQEVSESIGNATRDFAEYLAVMRGLQVAIELFETKTREMQIEVRLGSEMVKKQLSNESPIKEPGFVPYFIEIHNLRVSSFPQITFTYLDNDGISEAGRLVKEALDA